MLVRKATENTEELPSTHPIRLCLTLNLPVFHYGITNNPQQASRLAQGAFIDVMTGKSNLHEDSCKDGGAQFASAESPDKTYSDVDAVTRHVVAGLYS
ncbi:hypothetical protein AHF37_04452 [Paragonimus kellicotti]|nr:hypothetical protein AHF37_04452 [Paragonimus kellicotti]